MALLFMDGFDVADYGVKYTIINSGGGYSSTVSTRFGSGRAVQRAYNATGELWRSVPASTTTICGFAFIYTNNYAGFPANFIVLSGDSSTTDHISVVTGDAMNTLWVRRGGTTLFTVANITTNTWHYLELKTTINSTTGSVELRIDGVSVGTFSGNTKNGGTNNSIDTIKLGGSGNNTSITITRDDLYILDDTGVAPYNNFLGDVRVYSLSPTSAGSSTQWTPDSGSNYAEVNEVPYSAANYVQSNTSGQRDTYTLADLPAGGVTTVYGVQSNVIAKRTDAGAIAVKPVIKSGATIAYGSNTPLPVADTVVSYVRAIDPATSAAWTASGVNALEAGMEVS
jgi:hypothetical protein